MDLAFERLSSLNVSAATPVLLLAHGNGFCRQTWYAVLDELRCLAASGSRKGNVNGDLSFRAVLCDMRSHGDSPSANGRVGWEEQARDMNRIAKVVRKNVGRHVPIVAVGHSMGATALLLAELSNPGTFQAAVVAEPVSIPQNIVEELSPYASKALKRRMTWSSYADAVAHFERSFAKWDPRARNGYIMGALKTKHDGSVALKCDRMDEYNVYELSAKNRIYTNVAQIACPLYAIGGELSSTVVFHRMLLEQIESLENGSLTIAEGAGHNLPMEAPKHFARVIAQALSRLQPTPNSLPDPSLIPSLAHSITAVARL